MTLSKSAPSPTLRSLGFAVPAARSQADLARVQADAWGLTGTELARWERLVRGTSIERRHVIGEPEQSMRMSTGERMRTYEALAPGLAAAAARDALDRGGVDPATITDCIVVSCTGFMAPGVGAIIAPTIGLRSTVRHTQIGFMGCFGGILGLRAAIGAVAAEPDAVALVVCVELCSLHLRADRDPQNLVAAALFADGAAAAIVDGGDAGLGRLSLGRTLVVDAARDAMSWRIGDEGFAMTLTREVPSSLEESIGPFAKASPVSGYAIHPGGPGILDAIERGLVGIPVSPISLAASREILRTHGNTSSGSVYFVLDHYRRAGGPLPVDLLAFGPGLSIDTVRLG